MTPEKRLARNAIQRLIQDYPGEPLPTVAALTAAFRKARKQKLPVIHIQVSDDTTVLFATEIQLELSL